MALIGARVYINELVRIERVTASNSLFTATCKLHINGLKDMCSLIREEYYLRKVYSFCGSVKIYKNNNEQWDFVGGACELEGRVLKKCMYYKYIATILIDIQEHYKMCENIKLQHHS